MRNEKSMSKKTLIELFHTLTALELVIVYFYMLDLFQPSYIMLFRGATWVRIYKLGLWDDGLHALLPLLVLSLALGVCAYKVGGFTIVKPSKLVYYVLTSFTLIIGLSLLCWTFYMVDPHPLLEYSFRPHEVVSKLDAGLFYVYAPVYPLLLLTSLYSWLPSISEGVFKGRVKLKIKHNKALNWIGNYNPSNNVLTRKLGLASALLLSIILPLIPYLPSINPSFRPASVDIPYYSRWLDHMLMTDPWGAVEYAFYGEKNGNRPLYLLILYGLVELGIPRETVLNFEALLIAPVFVLAVYLAARQLSKNGVYASLASLVAVLSFNMTVGIYAGYFAAWTGLTLFYICIVLTLSSEGRRLESLIGSIVSSTALLYIHPWTWSVLMTVLTAYLVVSTIDSRRVNRQLLAVLLINVTVDVFKTVTSQGYGGLVSSAKVLGNGKVFGFKPMLELFKHLRHLSTTYMGGLFFNPLYMLLTLIGVLSLLKRRNEFSRAITVWVAVVSLVFPFSGIGLQSHLLFVTPFPLLITEGLWTTFRLLDGLNPKITRVFQTFFLVSSMTYAVRALCNLV